MGWRELVVAALSFNLGRKTRRQDKIWTVRRHNVKLSAKIRAQNTNYKLEIQKLKTYKN